MLDKSGLSSVKIFVLLFSAGLYGCTIEPSSFPKLSNPTVSKTSQNYSYSYPPSVLPKWKPTPPLRPTIEPEIIEYTETTGVIAGTSIPALLPYRIPLPKRNPRRGGIWDQTSNKFTSAKGSTDNGSSNPPEVIKSALHRVSTSGYRIKPGDTVYSISRNKRVSIRELIILNRLSAPFKLSAGQVIQLPLSKEHRVIAGDTVYSISRRYGLETTELVRLNKIQPPYALYVGQLLNLPALRNSNQPTAVANTTPVSATHQKVSLSVKAKTEGINRSKNVTGSKTFTQPENISKPRKFTGPVPSPLPRSASNFLRPLSGKVISSYGPKKDGIHNDGINIAARKGTLVKAAENGVVVYAGSELKGFGQMLLIKHTDGWVTAYAHTDQLLVGRGQRVKRGQNIAKVGSTGNVSKPQLHFEIRKGSEAVNPITLLTNKL